MKKPQIEFQQYFLASTDTILESDTIIPKCYENTVQRPVNLKMIGAKVEDYPNIWVIRTTHEPPKRSIRHSRCNRCGEECLVDSTIVTHSGMILCQACK